MPMANRKTLYTTFFDFSERGKLGLISLEENEKGVQTLAMYINNVEVENYYLKALPLFSKKNNMVLNGSKIMYTKLDYMNN